LPDITQIPGIEAVGIVRSCPSGEFNVGEQVVSIMGGMGRTRNGSYAQYVRARAANVVAITTSLPWSQIGAIPETYATAWSVLFGNLEIKPGQKLLIRAATSSLGQAAVKLAVAHGVKVVGTTRRKDRFSILEALGVERAEIETSEMSSWLPESKDRSIDAVLDLIGNSTILDSLKIPHRGGKVCEAGWLGGLAPIREFNPTLHMRPGVHYSLFTSTVLGTPEFPISDIPFKAIYQQVEEGKFEATPVKVFKFEQIREAQEFLENNDNPGKVVVVMD
jgi:NADPH2:quinone reductase